MRAYEITLIVDPKDKKRLTGIIAGIEKSLEKAKGKIVKSKEWGVKDLVYPIRKLQKGLFAYLEVQASSENIQQIKKSLQIEDNLLRYLVVKK